jgi:hypothetical protein
MNTDMLIVRMTQAHHEAAQATIPEQHGLKGHHSPDGHHPDARHGGDDLQDPRPDRRVASTRHGPYRRPPHRQSPHRSAPAGMVMIDPLRNKNVGTKNRTPATVTSVPIGAVK